MKIKARWESLRVRCKVQSCKGTHHAPCIKRSVTYSVSGVRIRTPSPTMTLPRAHGEQRCGPPAPAAMLEESGSLNQVCHLLECRREQICALSRP